MTLRIGHHRSRLAWLLLASLAAAPGAFADAVTDANTRAVMIVSKVKNTPMAVRAMALAQVSVFDAVQSISGRYAPLYAAPAAAPKASIEAAVAAATRTALLASLPSEQEAIEAEYRAALAKLPDGAEKTDGIAAGEKAAKAVLAARANDGAEAPNTYRPRTTPGTYVPTALPLVPHWGRRKPWLMKSGEQFRPGPPPKLDSEIWKRDLAESAALGGKNSSRRTPEQTEVARFWETTSPSVYWPIARSVASASGDVRESSRLLAEAAVAMDDAAIAVFDAKYHYEFWRPITAIRNAPANVRDPQWEPLVETPMHPEYPCAHCIVSSALGTVLESSIEAGSSPRLETTSPTAGGATRTWTKPADFMREVSEARIYAGVHYRNSTEVGAAMGRRIAELARARFPKETAMKER